MIADDKKSGKVAAGIKSVSYILNENAHKSSDDPERTSEDAPVRVLHVEVDHALPILAGMHYEKAAKQFINDIQHWNTERRAGKKPSADDWQQYMVGFDPDDKVPPVKAVQIAREALHEVATGERPTVLVAHGDKDHMHVHMLYSVVNHKGKIHNPHADFRLWERAMEKLELKYNLTRVKKRKACALDAKLEGNEKLASRRMPQITNQTSKEVKFSERTGKVSAKVKLREHIDQALAAVKETPKTQRFPAFVRELSRRNIGVVLNNQSEDQIAGVRFHCDRFAATGIKASKLGKKHSWPSLSIQLYFDSKSNVHLDLARNLGRQTINTRPSIKAQKASAKSSGPVGITSASSTCDVGSVFILDEYPAWLKLMIYSQHKEASRALQSAKAELGRQREESFKRLLEIFEQMLQAQKWYERNERVVADESTEATPVESWELPS